MIGEIFNKIFYQPLFNILILFVRFLPGHDLGVAIILLTLLIRIILHPLVTRSLKNQRELAKIQPKIQEIKKKYDGDKERQAKETLKLWQEAKINPFGGILFTIIQLPILIALFLVLRTFGSGLEESELAILYPFVSPPTNISPFFLGVLDLSKSFQTTIGNQKFYYWPAFPLILLALILSFFQMKTAQPKIKKGVEDPSQKFQKPMFYFFLLFTFFILIQFPLAIALYWSVTSLYSLIQQKLIFRT